MLKFFLALLANLVLVFWWPIWLLRRSWRPRGTWLSVELRGKPLDVVAASWPWRRSATSLTSLDEALRLAARDRRVVGALLTLRQLQGGGATRVSLRAALERFREANKQLVVFLPDGGDLSEYAVGSAANQLVLGHHGRLANLGVSVSSLYFKRALGQLGVLPEVFAAGKFKAAGETLVRESMSDVQRLQLDALLDQSFEWSRQAIAAGRHQSEERVGEWLDDAPYGARRALGRGLVDALAYQDELEGRLEALSPTPPRQVALESYRRWQRRRHPFIRMRRPRYLAVVNVHGVIVSEAPGFGAVADEESFVRAMERVRKDSAALGLLLHIDSRGGSASASARMLREVRRVAEDKPVVAYFGDVAASGGYMIGVGAHEIVAQPISVTGSIGVVAARLVVGPLLGRLGVDWTTLVRGARADMFSPLRPLDEDEAGAFTRELTELYEEFVEMVATGRNTTPEAIEPLAQGRVWSGRDAHDRGLVDVLGGFDVAVQRLRERVGQRGSAAPIELVSRPARPAWAKTAIGAHTGALVAESGLDEVLHLTVDPRRDPYWTWCPSARDT